MYMKGKELRKIRRYLGLTQVEMAKRLGVTSNSLARWERDEVPIREVMARFIMLLRKTEQPKRR